MSHLWIQKAALESHFATQKIHAFFSLTPHIDKSKLLQWMKEEAKYVLLLFFGFYFGWTYPLMTKLRIILSVESKQVARQISD